MGHVVIDIEALKKRHDDDSLQYYIWSVALHCKKSSRSFWALEKSLRFKDRLVSIPLLILSSATGLTSVTLLQQQSSAASVDAMVALGVSSACLAAIQKLTNYAARAEAAKSIAKAYARLARRVETTMVLVESSAVQMGAADFLKFIADMEKELDTILGDTGEVPASSSSSSSLPASSSSSSSSSLPASAPVGADGKPILMMSALPLPARRPLSSSDSGDRSPVYDEYNSQSSLRDIERQVHAMSRCANDAPPPLPSSPAPLV